MANITTRAEIEAQLEKETNPSIREILQNHLKRFDKGAPTTTEAPVENVVVLEPPVEKKARKNG